MNILRYKHDVLRMPWAEGGGTDGGAGSIGSNDSNDSGNRTWSDPSGSVTTNPITGDISWTGNSNGQPAGNWNESTQTATGAFNPNMPVAVAPPVVDQFTRLKELSDMFNKENPQFAQTQTQLPGATESLNQLTQAPPDLGTTQEPNQFDQNGLAYRLGLRMPGTEAAKNFFNTETAAERNDRMGLVGQGLGAIGNAVMGVAMPAAARLGMGMYSAYKGYQGDPNKDIGRAIATGAQSLPGYAGALANMYNGNYGAAVTGGLAKSGITGPVANVAGIGADYASGKNIAPSLGGLAGQFAGQSLGGPLGGMFGKSLGQQIGRNGSVRK